MHASRIRRSLAGLVARALLASLAVTTMAAPASAKQVTCRGVVATIVGTNGPDVIYGTNHRDIIAGLGGNDVIVGHGGNDIICGGKGADRLVGEDGLDRLYGNGGPDRLFGGNGPDRLYGGVGNDVLAGQVGNDHLNGGTGTDTCYQGQGAGAAISCERPVPKLIAIAYSDLDGNHQFDPAKDVLISKLVDTDGNGLDVGDRVVMGRYPITFNPIRPEGGFEEWAVKSHTVTEFSLVYAGRATVQVGANEYLQWLDDWQQDSFDERIGGTLSAFVDSRTTNRSDFIQLDPATPSHPVESFLQYGALDTTDHRFVDVEIYP